MKRNWRNQSLIHPSPLTPHPSDIEPWCNHHVLDAEELPCEQLRRQGRKYRYREELKYHVLQQRRALEYLFIELSPGDDEVDNQPRDDEESAYDGCAEQPLPRLRCYAEQVGQVAVDLIQLNVVIPGLTWPEPDPSRPANE